jgi:hypothetical protein
MLMKETFNLGVVEASGKGSEELVKKTNKLANDIKSQIQNAETVAVLVGRLVMFDTRGKVNSHSRIKVINRKEHIDYTKKISESVIQKKLRNLTKELSLKQSEVKKVTKEYVKLSTKVSEIENRLKVVEDIATKVHQEGIHADLLKKYDKHLKQVTNTLNSMRSHKEFFTEENLRYISMHNRSLVRELERWINE